MKHIFDKDVWIYAERLYLHARGPVTFRRLLRSFRISYDNPLYDKFEITSVKYTYLSENNYDFAQYMVHVPEERFLPLLEKIFFDPDVQATASDKGWNYYRNYIKTWLPALHKALVTAGVGIDGTNQRLYSRHDKLSDDKTQENPPLTSSAAKRFTVRDQGGLRKTLAENFSIIELRILCFDAGHNYENMSSETIDEFTMQLINYFSRRGEINKLLYLCQQQRVQIDWGKFMSEDRI